VAFDPLRDALSVIFGLSLTRGAKVIENQLRSAYLRIAPTAQSPDYVLESDPEADPEEDDDEDPEEDPVDYPADGGDDGEDEDEPSKEDEDDDVDIEADEEWRRKSTQLLPTL
ncbi:hypothetical protein Tco_1226373, partial [Tanacetum coccineum]